MRITICHFCGLSSGIFTTGKQFNEHLLKHKKLQFNCNQCAKILPTPKSLRDHQRDVHGEGFTCKCCNKQFSKKSNLNRHMQSTPKECEVCKISVSATNLKRHMDKHTSGVQESEGGMFWSWSGPRIQTNCEEFWKCMVWNLNLAWCMVHKQVPCYHWPCSPGNWTNW